MSISFVYWVLYKFEVGNMTAEQELKTLFAPAKRLDKNEVLKQKEKFEELFEMSTFMDTIPSIYLILNSNRQIVFANRTALDILGYEHVNDIAGLRPGEAINCVHSREMPGGCGTSEACSQCGAVQSILLGLEKQKNMKDCQVSTENNESYDFRVWANPYSLNDEKYVIFSMMDVSNENRRRTFERIFFHDVLNTASGIQGIMAIIQDYPEEISEFKDVLYHSSTQLISEIQSQRDLIYAENNELVPNITESSALKLLKYIKNVYSNNEVSRNKIIVIDETATDGTIETDESLLIRVLGNMLKNALEAGSINSKVILSSSVENGSITFSVHNDSYIQRNVQLQIFKRSFSTKGLGRGLGTYSMKLLSEKYLRGEVWFESDEDEGTVFYGKYPCKYHTSS